VTRAFVNSVAYAHSLYHLKELIFVNLEAHITVYFFEKVLWLPPVLQQYLVNLIERSFLQLHGLLAEDHFAFRPARLCLIEFKTLKHPEELLVVNALVFVTPPTVAEFV